MQAYLDNSATTRPDERVIEKMVSCLRDGFYNPSSVYSPAVAEMRNLRDARETILKAVHGNKCRLVFTSGGTEANNLAILGAAQKIRGLKMAAVSSTEHPSVSAAFEVLASRGIEVRVIPSDVNGVLDYAALENALSEGCGLVSVMQVNNETGAINDIPRLREMTRGRALLHVDGVQGFMRVPFEMKNADMYTVSAHKIHGPKGIGALITQESVRLEPSHIGGGQENGLRSGTENTPGIAGFAEAVRLISGADIEKLRETKMYLVEKFSAAVPGLLINGPAPENAAPHIVNLSFPDVRGEVMLHALEAEGIYASTGSACSSKKLKVSAVLTSMGIAPARAEWALRFSLSPFTTREEIDYAAEKLKKIYDQLKRFKRR